MTGAAVAVIIFVLWVITANNLKRLDEKIAQMQLNLEERGIM